jgi:hypothetical protein
MMLLEGENTSQRKFFGNAGALPTPTIDWKPDLTTLGFTGPYATCLKVPFQLISGANVSMVDSVGTLSNYDGEKNIYILSKVSATDTNTEYTGGDGIIVNNVTESIWKYSECFRTLLDSLA